MKLIKLTIISMCIFLCFSCATTSGAPIGSVEEEAESLFVSMKLSETYDETIEKSLEVQLQASPSMIPYKDVLLEFMKKYMSYESLKDELVAIYAAEFTAEELRDINNFYSTETGMKYALLSPELVAKGSELGVKRVQENMSELQEMIMNASAESE